MAYPTGRYGNGIRGLGDSLSFANYTDWLNGDSPNPNANPNYTDFSGYTNWISGPGVASGSVSPATTTNHSGTASVPSVNQWVVGNSGLVVMVSLALLGLLLLKR